MHYRWSEKTKSLLLDGSWEKKICLKDFPYGSCRAQTMEHHTRQARPHGHSHLKGQKKVNCSSHCFSRKSLHPLLRCLFRKHRSTKILPLAKRRPLWSPAKLSQGLSLKAQWHSGELGTSQNHLKRKAEVLTMQSTFCYFNKTRKGGAYYPPTDRHTDTIQQTTLHFLQCCSTEGHCVEHMEILGRMTVVRKSLTPRSTNPVASHQWLPEVLWFFLLRSRWPGPHPVAFAEQIPQRLPTSPAGSAHLSSGGSGWVMVHQDFTGDHGRGRENNQAGDSFGSIHTLAWIDIWKGSRLFWPVLHTQCGSMALMPSPTDPLASGLRCTRRIRKAREGRGNILSHYVLQAALSASSWELPCKLLRIWLRGWGEKRL